LTKLLAPYKLIAVFLMPYGDDSVHYFGCLELKWELSGRFKQTTFQNHLHNGLLYRETL